MSIDQLKMDGSYNRKLKPRGERNEWRYFLSMKWTDKPGSQCLISVLPLTSNDRKESDFAHFFCEGRDDTIIKDDKKIGLQRTM